MVYNKVYAQIGEERHIVLDPINYQYDIKQILVIQGETVPDYYEADVCNVGDTATLTMVGTAADGVEIPDKFLLDGRNVLVYIVIPGSGGDVQTRYDITIPVDERAEREDIDPSEAEQQQIDSLINALNSGVGRAETAATAAEESATDAEGSAGEAEDQAENAEAWAVGQRAGEDVPDTDPTYHNNSKYYAGMAEAAAEEAGQHEASWETWVQRAETAAGNAESSATAAGQSKTDAEAAAQTATQKATEAGNSAAAAAGSAASARQTVDGAIGAINTARDGALTAIGQAGTTQVNAVNQAGANQVAAVNQAGATQTQAVEDKGEEVIGSIPQDYSDLVDDVADLTRQLSDLESQTSVLDATSQNINYNSLIEWKNRSFNNFEPWWGSSNRLSNAGSEIDPQLFTFITVTLTNTSHSAYVRLYDANKAERISVYLNSETTTTTIPILPEYKYLRFLIMGSTDIAPSVGDSILQFNATTRYYDSINTDQKALFYPAYSLIRLVAPASRNVYLNIYNLYALYPSGATQFRESESWGLDNSHITTVSGTNYIVIPANYCLTFNYDTKTLDVKQYTKLLLSDIVLLGYLHLGGTATEGGFWERQFQGVLYSNYRTEMLAAYQGKPYVYENYHAFLQSDGIITVESAATDSIDITFSNPIYIVASGYTYNLSVADAVSNFSATTVGNGYKFNLAANEALIYRNGSFMRVAKASIDRFADIVLLENIAGSGLIGGALYPYYLKGLISLEAVENNPFISSDWNNTLSSYDSKISDYSDLLLTSDDCETFLFFTDPHLFDANVSEDELEKAVGTIQNAFNSTATTFCVCGGDWLQQNDTPSEAIYKICKVDGFMRAKFGDKYIPVLGNHDTNEAGTQLLPRESVEYAWFRNYDCKSYYTFEGIKTRFFVFDTMTSWDVSSQTDYENEQYAFFASTLTSNTKDNIILFFHILSNQFDKTTFESSPVIENFADTLLKIAKAFNTRGTYTIAGNTYDFASATGKVRLAQVGHSHFDSSITHETIPVVITTNTTTIPNFDLCIADYTSGKYKTIRIGTGSDREFNMVS